jgi:uncharacterized protein (DUF1810 family)
MALSGSSPVLTRSAANRHTEPERDIMFTLDRFREAQDAPHSGLAIALRELRAGRKTSHWIWYVFPQLAVLGRSSTAIHYGLAGSGEAADYLRDRVLGERLVAAAAVVRTHLADAKARTVRLEELMGSRSMRSS